MSNPQVTTVQPVKTDRMSVHAERIGKTDKCASCDELRRKLSIKTKECREHAQELNKKMVEIKRLNSSESCTKSRCTAIRYELQHRKHEITILQSESCTKTKCREILSECGKLQLQNIQLQSDLHQTKLRILEESRKEKERLQLELQEVMKSNEQFQHNILDIIGTGVADDQSGKNITLSAAILQIIQAQKQQLKSCAACSDMAMRLQRLQEAHQQMQQQIQEYQNVIRRQEEAIQRQQLSEQCQRSNSKEQRQKEVWQMGRLKNPGKDMEKQRVVEHDQLIQEFERLTTDPDGLLGVLEDTLQHHYGDEANFKAKKLLCALFQESYDNCKKLVIQHISSKLESLFVVQFPKTEKLEDASRGYGLFLHAFDLRTEELRDQFAAKIKKKVCCKCSKDAIPQRVKETLESSNHLGDVITLAWKFVTVPNPLIVCQPKEFNAQIHEPEYGHWDSKHTEDLAIVYTRPVVYRNHQGVLASKGWVANIANSQ